ncbi:MAG: phosphatidylglycerophosphatase A [Patescibacteria group bacterium]
MTELRQLPRKTRWAIYIMSMLGCGFSPAGPGTVGSAATVLLFWPLLFIESLYTKIGITLAAIILSYVVARIVGNKAISGMQAILGEVKKAESNKTTKVDYPQFVLDEFHGQLIALLPVFFVPDEERVLYCFLSFILFRIFDIFKSNIYPLYYFDDKQTIHGIMLDDTAAGIAAMLFLTIIINILVI